LTHGHQQSEQIMDRLRKEALTLGRYSKVRISTLDRLKVACDDILSGAAFKMAEKHGYADNAFPDQRPQLSYSLIEKYVRMRQRISPEERAKWTGPTASVISRDSDLKAYVDARRSEASAHKRRRIRSNLAQELEEIIGKIPIDSRYVVRGAIEQGRAWKNELDIARQAIKLMEPVPIERLTASQTANNFEGPTEFLAAPDAEIIRQLVRRLKTTDYLEPLGLAYSGGCVSTSFKPHRILVDKDEMLVLERLARVSL
jgi:hypothetical protein